MRLRIILLAIVVPAMLVAQEPQGDGQMPRFRAGANLVRVDAYVSKDGVPITDLKAEDFVVLEDDKLQQIENFDLIEARAPVPPSERVNTNNDVNNTVDMRQQAENAARVFTLFFDRLHVQIGGSYNAQKPIIETLDRVIGPDDLVGAMTPQMSPSSITYSRRTTSIAQFVTNNWHWGKRDSIQAQSPQEEALRECYGEKGAAPLIARLREQETLHALEALVVYLEGLRPERKFVLVFTEGWGLYKSDPTLAAGSAPAPDSIGVDPTTGKIRPPGRPDPYSGQLQTDQTCDRQRTMLAYIDHEVEFRELLQRANRANVSFYPVDARGLIVFDQPTNFDLPPSLDAAWLRKRHDDLRMMAEQTDGHAVLNTTNVSAAMQKMLRDTGSYYLLSYYSTNQKLDGRFRRIRVEVKRDSVDVSARPGYLAPTESEARAAGLTTARAGARGGPAPSPTVTRALDAIAPARGNLPLRIQASAARGRIRAIVELDPVTAKQPEWVSGGTLRLSIEPERPTGAPSSGGAVQSLTITVEPGQRSVPVSAGDTPLAPGRYSVRAELTPKGARAAVQATTFVTVPAESAVVGSGALALRRGPSTGLAYVPTADPRFRRTERLRIEVPVFGDKATATGRLLTREGQAMPLVVNYSTRVDEGTGLTLGVAELTLAPLAAGEYVLELSIDQNGKPEIVAYGFRIVP